MNSRKLSLVFDFDGTITEQDTIGVLANAAERFQRDRRVETSPSWSAIVEAYIRDHEQHTLSFQPPADQRRELVEELRFLRGLREIELQSLHRVMSSGLFRGMTDDILVSAGKQAIENGTVEIRDGFSDILKLASRNEWRVSILSVNWSASFILGVLDGFAVGPIVANEVQYDGSIHGPEVLGPGCTETVMTTCQDKERALKALLDRDGVRAEDVVYFGDSTSDIECLLLGKGVTVADDESSRLLKTLRRVGFEVPEAASARPHSTLVRSRTFSEVLKGSILE